MARKSLRSRPIILGIAAVALVLLLAWSFWPRPIAVDLGTVERTQMAVTVDEEARTRVRDAYVVAAPIGGRLLRVEVEAGDEVTGGESVIARMLAAPPSALDMRTREQARAGVSAAEAALRVARADLNSALAEQDFADTEFARATRLRESSAVSQADLEQAQRQKRAADSAVDTAKAAISMREAELANARARLIEFRESDTGSPAATSNPGEGGAIPLEAPITGRVLRVMQESETTLSPGQPILEIGDVSNDLEVITELLSSDAVQVEAGDKVLIDNWGGDAVLNGVVERVEPWGFTKYSALGVEEQRVNAIIRFTDPLDARSSLGHGYRVEVRIVIWEDEDALTLPSAALFRDNGDWSVFTVEDGRARQIPVEVVRNNGNLAAIESGLGAGTAVILYPGPDLEDGIRVTER
ncbi:HlyD family efflux transporter periplasmic adaptor subunit [Henriciella sp.]|uniref:efflux RND transporter periplasmic adaptor subunit n=1 Tax=Henriciella sp. TaxID=1968823 RepID=UPI00260AADBF|nr:HlyD family efflux transporter periplasmic adaptor subunit [Henriciella sp.]